MLIVWGCRPEGWGEIALKFMTWGTLYFEFLGPFLLSAPLYTDEFRTITVFLFMAMHLSFGMHLQLGFFAYIPCVCALGLLPPLFWDKAEQLFIKFHQRFLVSSIHRETRLVVCVDLSRKDSVWTQWWHVFISYAGFSDRLVVIQTSSNEETNALMNQHNTRLIVFFQPLDQQKRFVSDAATFGSWSDVLRFSPMFFPLVLMYRFFPRIVKRFGGQVVEICCHSRSWQEIRSQDHVSERNLSYLTALYLSTLAEFLGRLFLSRKSSPLVSRRTNRWKRLWKGVSVVIVIAVFVFCLMWNTQHHTKEPPLRVLQIISEAVQLDQWWGMFSPNPPLEFGWFVVCTFPLSFYNGP